MRGSSVAAACVEEIRAVLLWHAVSDPYALIRVARERYGFIYSLHAWWWGGGVDVVHERRSESIGIFVVLRRHKWSQRHTRGHRAATCGPRGALGAIHVAARARGGMDETRERSQRAESDLCVEKYRYICGYTLVAGLYMLWGGWHTRLGARSAARREVRSGRARAHAHAFAGCCWISTEETHCCEPHRVFDRPA